jgi:hypothetical protein
MYVKKTARPTWGGILLIIAGLLNIGSGIGASAAAAFFEDLFDFTGAIFAGAPLIFIGLVSLVGGILAITRSVWWLALVGGILAVLPSPGWLFGVPGLILVSLSKPEFDYKEVLMEERRGAMEMAPTAGINTATVQTYLRGINYPADKAMITSVAKANAAPDAVMMYMNRLPEREYRSSAEVNEEFSKIK